jgi:hypothetical protein
MWAPITNATSKRRSWDPGRIRPPLFRGMWAAPSRLTGKLGMEKREGGPRKWAAHSVCHEIRATTNVMACFHHLPFPLRSLTSPPERIDNAKPTTTASLPSPLRPKASRRWNVQRFQHRFPCFQPPSHPNASRRWIFLAFQHVCHYHHLPRV